MNKICEAIENKKVIEFVYKNYKRIVEPHCYGVHKDTKNEVLHAYQVGGYTSSGKNPPWRIYIVSKMSEIVVTDRQFENPRPDYTRNDLDMSKIFYQL